MKSKLLLLMLLQVVYLPFAKAEDAGTPRITEDDYIGEVPRVLTVSRLSQPLSDAPSAVTIIDQETIRASGIVDLPEIFRLVPGFYVGTNAGYVHNTNHAVSYHGMTTAYPGAMQVMINGRSVYSPLYGGVQWSELPLAVADIERIEVTRGPNAASYGANSYFGVINIITKHPSELPENTVIGTHGNGRNEAFYRHAGRLNDLNYRATVGYRQDDGLDQRNDFKRTRLLNAQADYQINTRNALELEFGLAGGARGEGDIKEDPIVFIPRTKQINNHYELIRWRSNIGDTSDFSLQAYHSYSRSDDETTSVNLRPIVASTISPVLAAALASDTITIKNPVEEERYDVEAQHTFALGNQLRFVWGGSIRRDSMYAPYYLGTKKTDYFDLQRIFGHAEWQPSVNWVLNAGAMVEHNDFTGTDTSPRVSINFKPSPNHAFRLGVSTAMRTPNYIEEKFNRSIQIPTTSPLIGTLLLQQNADLGNVDPEKIVSREIGYLGEVGRFSLDARIFHDTLTNQIHFTDRTDFVAPPGYTLVTSKDISTGTNAGTAVVEGAEFQTKWQFTDRANLLLNYARVNIRETQDGLRRNTEKSMPKNTVSALLTYRFDSSWDTSLAYYQTSETTQLGDGDPVGLIRKYDLRVARKFNSGRWIGEVSGVVENLFDNHYQEFADYNTLGRRARINLRLDF